MEKQNGGQKKNQKMGKKTYRTPITIIVIACAVVVSFLLSILSPKSQGGFWEVWYYIISIFSAVAVISGVIIAVWQYYLSSKSVQRDLAITQVQRAVDLSAYYKNHILSFHPAIYYIFEKSDVLPLLLGKNIHEFKDFDKKELSRVFSQEEIQRLKKVQSSESFCEAVLQANQIYNLKFKVEPVSVSQVTPKGSSQSNSVCLEYDTFHVFSAFMRNLIDETLNNMEYFSMHFTHQTADESVVYQSLHQTYIDIVRLLYYFIAARNEDPSEKYYTNVIQLYETWLARRDKQEHEHIEKARSIPSRGTVIEN